MEIEEEILKEDKVAPRSHSFKTVALVLNPGWLASGPVLLTSVILPPTQDFFFLKSLVAKKKMFGSQFPHYKDEKSETQEGKGLVQGRTQCWLQGETQNLFSSAAGCRRVGGSGRLGQTLLSQAVGSESKDWLMISPRS